MCVFFVENHFNRFKPLFLFVCLFRQSTTFDYNSSLLQHFISNIDSQINSLVIEDNGLDFRDKALAFYADNIQDQYTVVTRMKG